MIASTKDKFFYVAVLCLFAAAICFRLPAIINDLWLDEVWSLGIVAELNSPLEVFTEINHSNNHFLYTLFIYCIGETKNLVLYRVPCFVSGIITLIFAALIEHKRGKIQVFFILLLFTVSYIVIHYSTEARGYGMVIMFSLMSFYFFEKNLERSAKSCKFFFSLCVVLGFFSHLMFFQTYLSLVLWSLVDVFQKRTQWKKPFIDSVKLHAPPVIVLVLFYFMSVKPMRIGLGPEFDVLAILGEAVTLIYGLDYSTVVFFFTALLSVGFFSLGVWVYWVEKNNRAIFFLIAVPLLPVVSLTFFTPNVLFVRYFLLSITFFLFTLSTSLTWFYEKGGVFKILSILLVLSFVSGNLFQNVNLWKYGRGNYTQALQDMVHETNGAEVTIGSDHDFRNALMLGYYVWLLNLEKPVQYYDMHTRKAEKKVPQWLILHRFETRFIPKKDFVDFNGNYFVLYKTYRYSNLSGWNWILYKKSRQW